MAEQLTLYLLVVTGIVSFLAGYILADFGTFIKLYFAGAAITGLAVLPDWPFYNRHPLGWIDPATKDQGARASADDSTLAAAPKKKAKK